MTSRIGDTELVQGSLEIRQAEPEDFEAWFELFEVVASEGRWIGAEAPVHRAWAEAMFERLCGDPASALLLAHDATRLVGISASSSSSVAPSSA